MNTARVSPGSANPPNNLSTLARLRKRISYASRWLPTYAWQRLTRRTPQGPVHLIFALADHFEPAIIPQDGQARAPYQEQERRLERWCATYPRHVEKWRDHEGRPFVHTYFYPAEQYDKNLVARLAEHCHAGWGEIEIHLHHGVGKPDKPENTRRVLSNFRDILAFEHGCLASGDGDNIPRYAFVHGNFALANSAGGRACGVDSEMLILAETGCYADLTLPASIFHWAQTAKINSLYECGLPLDRRAPHRRGRDLESGRPPKVFPLIIQGPLLLDFRRPGRRWRIEAAAFTNSHPPDLHRLRLWRRAAICVRGRPDWLFIKLHCHGMDPTQELGILGRLMQQFLKDLIEGAGQRKETLHFVTAREMVNIVLAACDGREGNPGDFRDYRLGRFRADSLNLSGKRVSDASVKA